MQKESHIMTKEIGEANLKIDLGDIWMKKFLLEISFYLLLQSINTTKLWSKSIRWKTYSLMTHMTPNYAQSGEALPK